MRYLSVCSGIEAATVAWHPLGWQPFAFAEIEKFPSAVLAHHYPSVPNLGDMTKFRDWPDAAIDVLVGGTPCQSFSVAGLRKGMADPRGNLALTYLAIADRYKPAWLIWENVPGVLSSNGGRDFGAILGGMAELGYGFAYRVLDAQYVRTHGLARAVPQRRRRVFVVGYLGDWRRAAAVLFERESLLWDSAPRRQAGKGFAQDVVSSFVSSGRGIERTGETRGQDPVIAVPSTGDIAHCLNAGGMGRQDYETETVIAVAHALRADGFDASEDGTGRGTPLVPIAFDARQSDVIQYGDKTGPLDTDGTSIAIAFAENQRGEVVTGDVMGSLKVGGGKPGQGYPAVAHPYTLAVRGRGDSHQLEYRQDGTANAVLTPNGGRAGIGVGAVAFTCSEQANSFAWDRDVYPTLDAQLPNDSSNIQKGIRQGWAVRRLTPRECERLQGFPDDYTAIPKAADGPRYKALGNSMAVNVMRWLGQRIAMVSHFHEDRQ